MDLKGKGADRIIIDDAIDESKTICQKCKTTIFKNAPIFGDYCKRNGKIEYENQYCFHCWGFAPIVKSEALKRINESRWIKLTSDLEEDIQRLVYDYKEACAEAENPNKH